MTSGAVSGWRAGHHVAVRRLTPLAITVVGLIAAKLVLATLDTHQVLHASTPLPVVVLGTIIGVTYGLLAVGLVLIYRTNRIINFAHGQIGAFGAALFGLAAVSWGIPYWLGFVLALAASAAVGAAAETGVVRRLRHAPRLMSVVATLGVGQFLVLFASVINGTAGAGALYPQPAGLPQFKFGALLVTPAYSGMLFLSPIVVIAIGVFLKRSRFGLGIRAAAANPEAARMAGIFASRMSSLAWAIAGALSAFTAILTAPTQGFTTADTFGPALLLRALTAAIVGRMNSLPLALAGGIGLGIIEQLLLWNYPRSGLVEVTLFAIILLVLLLQRQRGGRQQERGSWAAVQALRPIPEQLRQLRAIRRLPTGLAVAFIAGLALLPLVITNSLSVSFTGIIGFSIVGLSIGVLTGLGGQLTLGQFAVAAIGAVVSYQVSSHTGNFPLALAAAGLVAGIVSVIIGLPALRVSGLMLTVTTLGFALATPAWLLAQSWMLGDGRDPGQPILFGHALNTGHSYYYFALTLFVLALLVAHNIRRGGFGRLLVAIRDNEDNARAFAVRASMVKLEGYLVAGFIAGLGGATYGHALSSIGTNTFPTAASITVVVMTVLGGVGVLFGPVLGAMWVLGLPLVNIGNIGLAASAFGALLVILWRPAGLVQLVEPVREYVVKAIARRRGVDPEPLFAGDTDSDTALDVSSVAAGELVRANVRSGPGATAPDRGPRPILESIDLTKRFGGIVAVDDFSIVVSAGETVGLIGPNGAGKTTAFEMLGGFLRPDHGRVMFQGADVSRVSAERRAHAGLIRSFQDAALFPTMTVKDAVMLALERVEPTRFVPSVLGMTRSERRKEPRARALIAFMGLDRYRDKQVQELSTGTRRIVELACLVALEPVCLLLDEPSSGIAQRETEALGDLLTDLKAQLGLTLFVIEHDIPLIMGIADRIIAMDRGRVIASGTPSQVSTDPLVVDAYFGGRFESSSSDVLRSPDRSLEDVLRSVRGVGHARQRQLLAAFGDADALGRATVDELRQVGGVGPALAVRIRQTLDRELRPIR
jgi:ABC-type branched-subunit amino acid transport system ATPase component/ABC-type branched-subunit amino acid transport system permease subunit